MAPSPNWVHHATAYEPRLVVKTHGEDAMNADFPKFTDPANAMRRGIKAALRAKGIVKYVEVVNLTPGKVVMKTERPFDNVNPLFVGDKPWCSCSGSGMSLRAAKYFIHSARCHVSAYEVIHRINDYGFRSDIPQVGRNLSMSLNHWVNEAKIDRSASIELKALILYVSQVVSSLDDNGYDTERTWLDEYVNVYNEGYRG